jgi:tetratricopeptide (TPR) repeat protein
MLCTRYAARSCVVLGLAACGHATAVRPAPTPGHAASATAALAHVEFVSPYSYEWFVRAELLQARGQYGAAVEAYRSALSSADEDPYLLSRLAEALDRAGDADAAQHALSTALELDPRSEAAWLARGRIATRRGAVDQALAAYERAESAAPSAPDAPLELAELLRAHGQLERAVAVLERFAARSEQGSLPALRARLELARARGDGAALEDATRVWLERHAGDPQLLRKLAAELLASARPALASRVLAAIPESEQDARLRLQVGLALMQREPLELLLATTPPEALGGPLEVAEAYLRIGDLERALAALDEQAVTDDDPARRALLRGLVLLELGQAARAAQWLASIPRGSAYRARALRGLEQALEAAGLGALGREVGALLEPASRERSSP